MYIHAFRHLRALLLPLTAGVALQALPLSAQQPAFDPVGVETSRAELQTLVERLDAAAASPAYTEHLRARAAARADSVRSRLEAGDFRPGDRIIFRFQGEEPVLDTLVVRPGPRVTLPLAGNVSLQGVLRSEVEEHLTARMAEIVVEPDVQAQPLVRVAILGQVGQPGYYTLPANTPLAEVVMRAGGPGPDANLDELRIERSRTTVRSGALLQEAVRRGATIQDIDVQEGDRIFVPQERTNQFLQQFGRYAMVIGSTLLLGVRVF